MTVTFYSNFFSHHQKPLSDYLFEVDELSYHFVETKKMPSNYLKSKYPEYLGVDYVIKSHRSKRELDKARYLALNSDLVILGSASFSIIKERLNRNKPTILYSERLFKKGIIQIINPIRLIYYFNKYSRYRNKKFYLFCASAYAPNDFSLIKAFPNKMLKWGYFTKFDEISIEKILNRKRNKKFSIVFVGRLVPWKHPEMLIPLAKELKKDGLDFEIKLIGVGFLEKKIKTEIKYNLLEENFDIIGAVDNSTVLKILSESHICISLSDRNEGWGTVVNEAMSNGCVIVASNAIGSVPYLIEPNKTGMIFRSGNVNEAVGLIHEVYNNKSLRESLAQNAYLTIKNLWSPEVASERFMMIARQIVNEEELATCFSEGPCSVATPFAEKWLLKNQNIKRGLRP